MKTFSLYLICSILFTFNCFAGSPWRQFDSLSGGIIHSLHQSGTMVFASNQRYLYRSEDQGQTWNFAGYKMLAHKQVFGTGSGIYIVSNNQSILYSGDAGANWTSLSRPDSGVVRSIAMAGTTLFMICSDDMGTYETRRRIYISQNGGMNWTLFSELLFPPGKSAIGTYAGLYTFYQSDTKLYWADSDSLYSTIDGKSVGSMPLGGLIPHAMGGTEEAFYFADVITDKIRVRKDGAFIGGGEGLPQKHAAHWIRHKNDYTLACMYDSSARQYDVYSRYRDAASWTRIYSDSRVVHDGIYMGQDRILLATGDGVLASADGGISWTSSNKGMHSRIDLFAASRGVLIARNGSTVRRSADRGQTWQPILQEAAPLSQNFSIRATANAWYALNDKSIYRSVDGLSWVKNDLPQEVLDSALILTMTMGYDNTVILSVLHPYPVIKQFRSDDGVSWDEMKFPAKLLDYPEIIASGGGKLYAYGQYFLNEVSMGHQFAVSADNGATWTSIKEGLPRSPLNGRILPVNTILTDGTGCTVATASGIYRYNGSDWQELLKGMPDSSTIHRLAVLGSDFLIAGSQGLLRYNPQTPDNKAQSMGLDGITVADIAIDGNSIYAVTDMNGVYALTPTTGIADGEAHLTDFSVYPNPVTGSALISCPEMKSFRIFSQEGNEHSVQYSVAGDMLRLETDTLAAGAYYAQWSNGAGLFTVPFVIAR